MGKTEQSNDVKLTTSKQRKAEREKERLKEKKEILIWKIVLGAIGVVILALIIYGLVSTIMKNANKVTASDDYSAVLEDNGFVKGVDALKCVTLPDYKNLVIPMSDVEYTDAEVDEVLNNALSSHMVLSTDTEAAVADGDKVNIDYVGTIDGEEFAGGNSGGNGYDLTIGSKSFIDTFEDQIIGHVVGDQFEVNVTFPEGYQTAELAGKPAVFAVTLNGIYIKPELTDEFIKEYYSEYANTVDEYKAYIKNDGYEKNVKEYVEKYIDENTVATDYPKEYLKNLKSIQKNYDLMSYDYMNQMSLSYYGYNMYQSFDEYTGKPEAEYDESLNDTCKESEKTALAYQAILENEGVTVSVDEYKAYRIENGGSEESLNSEIESYGTGYVMQNYVRTKALEIVEGYAKVQ